MLSLVSDDDSSTRSLAASTLGELGKKESCILPQLVQWLQENQDYPQLGYVINALWQIVVEEG